jgi:hypothetical protein
LLVLGLATMAALVLIVWLIQGKGPSQAKSTSPPPEAAPHLAAARTALDQGNFRTALQELDLVRSIQDRLTVSLAERRELTQLRRQAALMADLLGVPLEEVLREADDLGPEEWQLVFRDRYRGKAVLFDAEVSRDPAGHYELGYSLRPAWEGEPARVAIGDLELITDLGKNLHLDQAKRLIFGGRLAGIGQEPSGNWVVHFQPQSGVLFTDRAILVVACPALREDARELERTLKRQAEWLAALP